MPHQIKRKLNNEGLQMSTSDLGGLAVAVTLPVEAGPSQFLTEREREALGRLVRGESTAGMARAMGVHVSTARTHIDAVLCKLGAHTRLEAVAYAVREGLVDVSGWQFEQHAAAT